MKVSLLDLLLLLKKGGSQCKRLINALKGEARKNLFF
mgnify:CR=1 FL=1|jgi:hypothetical protein